MAEKVLSAFFVLISLGYLYFAREMTFGALGSPKSGFLPILTGIGASILAVINFIPLLNKPAEFAGIGKGPKKLLLFCLSLVAYIVLLKWIGYFAATLVALFCLLKVSGERGLFIPFLLSVGVAGGFYLTFGYLLGITFP